jgi:hypothetical protein
LKLASWAEDLLLLPLVLLVLEAELLVGFVDLSRLLREEEWLERLECLECLELIVCATLMAVGPGYLTNLVNVPLEYHRVLDHRV